MNFPSQLLEKAVNELSRFPGVGKKSALRMALHLLRQNEDISKQLGEAIIALRSQIKYCNTCGNVSDTEICNICSNQLRQRNQLCVVEDLRDVMAIENTAQYQGMYHVLGGVLSPIDGIGPDDINVSSLFKRLNEEKFDEVILALSATVEGDTTMYYIRKKLKEMPVKVSVISRGISVGGSLEYADEVTLGRSIISRIPFEI
ncbi:MAG: recombination protein RecR [Bacteroidetes bacterium]|nr:recombination protein RecR [Bacteroidota bacterium]